MQNEAGLRDAFAQAVGRAGGRLRLERGRQDARLNRVIMEFKFPGSFGGRSDSRAFREAFGQLQGYIARQSRDDGWEPAEYVGVAFDGFHLAYVFLENGIPRHTPLVPLNRASADLLFAYLAEDRRRAFTSENMLSDFGLSHPNTKRLLQGLWGQLAASLEDSAPRTTMLFAEWRRPFAQVADLSRAQAVLGTRLLDPTCGSGTFLILAIRRFLTVGREKGLSDEELLRGVCSHIVGFDLNPLAVISARVNYLLAIAELLTTSASVEIPVYLADAIYAPTIRDTLSESPLPTRTYCIGTAALTMDVELPEALIQNQDKFTTTLDLMETDLVHGLDVRVFQNHLLREQVLTPAEIEAWGSLLGQVYEKVAGLHSQEWNRIWCRILRNYFASVAVGQFDLIVGNPPWVRWSKLPDGYRALIKPTCESYRIFSDTPYHGGNELDISGVILYATVDKWLKKGGKLAFIITQSHFQAPSSQGVRRFHLVPSNTPLKVISVDDFQATKPFPKLANKPAVLVLEKGQETVYPVEYRIWHRREPRGLPEEGSWEQIEPLLESQPKRAMPVAPQGGRWSLLSPSEMPLLDQLKGGSPHLVGRKGVTTDLNGVYFIEVLGPGPAGQLRFQNPPESGHTPLGSPYEGMVESELVFPLIKGAGNIRAFQATLDARCILLPNRGIHSLEPEEKFAARYRLAYEYFRRYQDLLARRSTYRTRMLPHGAPFYAVYNVGPYTFKPWKVVWAEVAGSLQATVMGRASLPHTGQIKPVVPDHKVYFVAFDREEEAHFVCALLNSRQVRTFVNSFTVKTQVSNLFRILRLPPYLAPDPRHQRLAELSQQAHAGERRQEEIDTWVQEVIG